MEVVALVPGSQNIEQLFPGAFVAVIDGKASQTEEMLYEQLESAFQLPDYFGKNLDALYDCLNDLSWVKANEIVFYIKNYPLLLDDDGTTTRYEFMQLIHETAINWNTSANFDEKTFLIRVEQSAFAATELVRFGLISEDVTD